MEFSYTGDLLHNARGGISRGTDFLGMADVELDAAARGGTWLEGASVHAHVQYTHGGGFSATRVGDLQTVSNIDAPAGARVMELWMERDWGEHASLRAGLYNLNSEFDATDTGGHFINSSHGIGPDISQSGGNGPSIFPTTSLALRGEWRVDSGVVVRGAVLDAVPGDPDEPGRTAIRLNDGVLGVFEVNMVRPATRVGVGGWRYSRSSRTIDQDGRAQDWEQGIYAFVEHALAGDDEAEDAARFFLRIGRANAAVEQIGFYAGAGLVLPRGLSRRLDDTFGCAVGFARNGRAYLDEQARLGLPATSHETAIEITWRVQITDGLAIQPDLQYVVNPGTDATVGDALIVGVRLVFSRALRF